MGGGPGGIGRRGGKGAVDQEPTTSRADWNSFPALSNVTYTSPDGVPRLLWEILGAQAMPGGAPISRVDAIVSGNVATAMPFVVGDDRTLTGVALYTIDAHTAGAQACRVAIYTNADDGFYPSGLVWDSGSKPGIGVGGSGTTTIVMGQPLSVSLTTGLYWAVVMVNAQWRTDGRTLSSFNVDRWSPGIWLQSAAGNANTPGPSTSHHVGWQIDVGSFTMPDPFPVGADPVFGGASPPSVFATWGP